MNHRLTLSLLAGVAALVIAAFWIGASPTSAPAQVYQPARTADGRPDLNGIWQAMNTANWDIQDHPAKQGAVTALGAAFSVPAGKGVVEGNEIPYLPEAAEKKKENAAKWLTSDPEIKCYLPGVPRAAYMPYPFQIFQSRDGFVIAYEYAAAVRNIYLKDPGPPPSDTWMGQSVGRWEGETFVVETTGFNGMAWLDRSGNFTSANLKVI